MEAARRAGTKLATSAAATSTRSTAAKVTGSEGLVSKRKPARKRPAATAAAIPSYEPEGHDGESLPQDHGQDLRPPGPERHPDPDLLRPLADGVRDDAGDTGRGDDQREDGEDAEKQGGEPR